MSEMRRPRLVVLAAIVAVGVAVAIWVALRPSPAGSVTDPHALAKFAPGEMDRILRAAGDITQKTSQAELVAQGRTLFRSTTLAQRGESCQTCHADGGAVAEIGVIPHCKDDPDCKGPKDFNGPRESIAMWGIARSAPYGWAGQTPTVEAFATNTIKNFFKDHDPKPERVAAMSAYLRSLEPPVTAFDLGTLSDSAKRGMALFNSTARCSECHLSTGARPLFTDGLRHNILVPQFVFPDGVVADDPGASPPFTTAVLPCSEPGPVDPPCFNTPILRDVANTAPYMQNGVFATLQAVIHFYDVKSSIAGSIDLDRQDVDDLVAFLESL